MSQQRKSPRADAVRPDRRVSPKFTPPPVREATLHRPRLFDRLSQALRGRLTLVAADAGFGKTTLLSDYIHKSGRATAWVRLDAFDNDPAVFTRHLIDALLPHVRRGRRAQLRRGIGLVGDWITAAELLSALAQDVRHDVVLVLDDHHVLNAPTLSAGMTRWIEDLPPRVHLVILSRTDPELPLARWRAEGNLAEFGSDDLRFTPAELRALLVGQHGLPLTDTSLRVLAAKTEGWAAGIVLALNAALSQGPAQAAQTIGSLSGSSRHIYDYLVQEAFDRQTADAQRFLLATSLLSRFTAEIAGALLGIRSARRIVSHLERSHLFVVALDRERRWYRYHHLFQEFLRRIFTERDPDEVRAVHLRAVRLWEEEGEVAEAIEHALAAGSHDDAARLVAAVGDDVIATGQFDTVRRWIARIPARNWDRHPRLFLARGMCEMVVGDREAGARTFYRAYVGLRDTGDREGEVEGLRQFAARVLEHGGWHDPDGEPAGPWREWRRQLRAIFQNIQPRLQEFPAPARANLLHLMGWMREVDGEFDAAEGLQREAYALALESGDEWAQLSALRALARVLTTRGRVAEACRVFEAVIETSRNLGWAHEEAHFHVFLSELLADTGHVEDAEAHLREASALAQIAPCRFLNQQAHFLRALVAQASSAQDAEDLLRDAVETLNDQDRYARACALMGLLLARRDAQAAEEFARRAVLTAANIGPIDHGRALLALGTVTRSSERCREAAGLLEGAPHWKAMALVRAAEYASGDRAADAHRAALGALQSVPDEAWSFLVAHAGDALAAYRDDPAIGPRLAAALRTKPTRRVTTEARCLGTFELLREGISVPASAWERASTRRLLQYLLVHDRPAHREEVLEALWPDLEPAQAGNQLRVALSRLRRVLEPVRAPRTPSSLIVIAGSTLALARDRFVIDIDRFAAAAARASSSEENTRRSALLEAVGLYRGDLLEDSPYEDWIQPHRERLARRYLEILAMLATDEERSGEWASALERWRRIVDRDPGAEHAYRGLMRCYAAMGRAADVLRAFDDCRTALADLGAGPSAETLALRDSIATAGL